MPAKIHAKAALESPGSLPGDSIFLIYPLWRPQLPSACSASSLQPFHAPPWGTWLILFCPWRVLQSTGAMMLMELFGCASPPCVGQTLSCKTWASYIGMQVKEESPESLWTILCYSLFGFLSSFYLYFLIPTCVWYGSWILRIPDA